MKKAQILDRGIGHIDRDDAIFKAILDGMIISDQKSRVVLDANPAACRLLGYSLIEFNNKKLIEFIHPDSQESFNQKIDLFPTSGVLEMEVRLLCKDGSSIFAEWHGTPLNFHDQPEMLSFLHVPDRNKKPDTGLRELIIQHDHEQVGLMMILHTLVSTLDFQPALILEQLQTIIEFSRAGLFAIKNNALIPLALHGSAELENAANFQIPLTDPELLTISYNGNQPTRISNIWGEKQSAKELRSLLDGDWSERFLAGMNSWMWVPVAVNGRTLGSIGLAHPVRNYFTTEHGELALRVGDLIAIAMTNMELYAQAKILGSSEERQRLAQNLHSVLNQSLFSIGLLAEVIPRLWERDQTEARRSLEEVRRLTRGVQAEIRGLLADMRPSILLDTSLDDLLRLLGYTLSSRTNIPVTVKVEGYIILPMDVQDTIYRICQEALQNIAKHANAQQVQIDLNQNKDMVEVSIRDDGLGFDTKVHSNGHYGLKFMHEWADSIGALLTITSNLGQGTELEINWSPEVMDVEN